MSDRSKAAKKAWRTRRRKQRKLSQAAKKAGNTRLSTWENLRRGILLIECIPERGVDCSEAKMLNELFRIINFQMRDFDETVDFSHAEANSAGELLNLLRGAEQSCIHISCHGKYYENFRNYRRTGLRLKEGRLFADEICSLEDKNRPIWDERRDMKNIVIPHLFF